MLAQRAARGLGSLYAHAICWSKFLNAGKFYEADVLILGGDMTGKAVVPIVHQGGDNYKVNLLEQEFSISSDEEMKEMIKRIRSRGYYPYRTNPEELQYLETRPDEVHKIFCDQVLRVVQQCEAVVPVGAPLVELGDAHSLEIVVDVLTADAALIGPGSDARLDRGSGAPLLTGRVRRVEPAAFTKVSALGVEEQRVNVEIDFTSPEAEWRDLGDGYKIDARPLGHTGMSITGQFLAMTLARVKVGDATPIAVDADHLPLRAASGAGRQLARRLIREAADRSLFTLDPHFCFYGGDARLMRAVPEGRGADDEAAFRKRFSPGKRRDLAACYVGKRFRVPDPVGRRDYAVTMSAAELADCAVRFQEPLDAIQDACAEIRRVKGGTPCAIEVSVDEVPGISEPHHFYYLCAELARRDIRAFSLAPGLGFSKLDVDVKRRGRCAAGRRSRRCISSRARPSSAKRRTVRNRSVW